MTKTGFDFQTLARNVPPIMSLDHLETFLGGVISTKRREKSIMVSRVTLASEIVPQPRLYTLLLGQSADERKSTALKKVVDHFREPSAVDRREKATLNKA
jgi:hypothetical protein